MSTSSTIRVVTYNVHFGANTQELISVFRRNRYLSHADVIFFQEIEEHKQEGMSRAEKFAKALGLHFVYEPARPVKLLGAPMGTHGLAICSRFPLTHTSKIDLPIYNKRFRPLQRIALVATIELAGQTITLCNIHLDVRINAKQRVEQVDVALQEVKNKFGKKIILGGDFNTIPLFLAGKLVPVFYTNQLRHVHEHLLSQGFSNFCELDNYTLKKGILEMYLDHVYTDQLPIVECGVEQHVFASDHKPVWCDVKIN